ncbi:hypothetical protein [Psychrobacter pygoscelis]|uniref:hypothetical protein n=1 Tax=Psychrobacter pygoscelis TaxID=2488563 RepID=UPI00103DEBB6|nr:hypothetical protein [Psychrobacter pygoscelis]
MVQPVLTVGDKSEDAKTGLHYCMIKADGKDVMEGVGDTPYQAKRNAVAKYRKENPLAFLDIPE